MSDDLIAAHRDLPKLMPYLHLPVQSGSDRVLAAMNRKHERDFYLRLVERLRQARPDLALSGDFIVGFPGETRRRFRRHAAARRGGRLRAGLFLQIQPAPRHARGRDADQVPEEVKSERLRGCRRCSPSSSRRSMRHARAAPSMCCWSGRGKRPGQLVGKSPWLQAVQVDAPANDRRDRVGHDRPHRIEHPVGTLMENSTAGDRVMRNQLRLRV